MDKVQIYTIIWIALGATLSWFLDGKPREGNHEFKTMVLGILISVPIYGRIFGWW